MNIPEAVPTRWNHSPKTWKKRLQFAEILGRACASQDVALEWLDDEKWAGIMRSQRGKRAPVYGYDLGLNRSAAAKIADSKADTYALLKRHNVPAIRHERITSNLTDGSKSDIGSLTEQSIALMGLPLVLKPDAGQSGGAGVELCPTQDSVLGYIQASESTRAALAASPFTPFDEYRVIVLDGQARGIIEKKAGPDGWMHNHSKGAEHSLLSSQHELYEQIGELGVAAAGALDLQFTTVDVAHTHRDSQLAILEANDVVSMVQPRWSDIGQLAEEVYADAVAIRLA